MERRRTTGLECTIDAAAAGVFALCAGWSLNLWGFGTYSIAGGTIGGSVAAFMLLQSIKPSREPSGFEPAEAEFEELVDDTLLLEDRLESPQENARVVRLFTADEGRERHVPGELAERIDDFLGSGRDLRISSVGRAGAAPDQPDAAQELFEALAQIRQTLR